MKNDLSHHLAIAIVLAGVALALVSPSNASQPSLDQSPGGAASVTALNDR